MGSVLVTPGNPGMTDVATVVPGVAVTDPDAIVRVAREHAVDLAVIGPEAPRVAGVADRLRDAASPPSWPSARSDV